MTELSKCIICPLKRYRDSSKLSSNYHSCSPSPSITPRHKNVLHNLDSIKHFPANTPLGTADMSLRPHSNIIQHKNLSSLFRKEQDKHSEFQLKDIIRYIYLILTQTTLSSKLALSPHNAHRYRHQCGHKPGQMSS